MTGKKQLGEFVRGDDHFLVEFSEKTESGQRTTQTRVVKLTQDALDRYWKRGQLDKDADENQRLYDAGARLRGDFYKAGLTPNVAAPYSDLVSGGSVSGFSNIQVEAYTRYRKAIQAVGIGLAHELTTVCCLGEPVGVDGLVLLRRGLSVLAAHYGY